MSWYHGPGGPIERVWHEPAPVATIAWHTREPLDGTRYGERAHDLARARCRFVHTVVERRVAIAKIRERCHFDGYVWPWAA